LQRLIGYTPEDKLRFVNITLALALTFLGSSLGLCDENKDLIDKALKVSGIYAQLDDLGQAILAAVPADALPSPKLKNDAAAFVKKAATKASLVELLQSALKKNIDKQAIEQVIQFYETKLGKRVSRVHETALETTTLKNIRESRKLLASLDETRLSMLRGIMESEGALDANKALLNTVVHGLAEGALGASPEALNRTKSLLDNLKIVDKFLAGNRVEETALMAYAYNYRQLDDKELQELANFLQSAGARKFNEAVGHGLDLGVHNISKALGEAAAKWKETQSSK
jgi:hypothetical protein